MQRQKHDGISTSLLSYYSFTKVSIKINFNKISECIIKMCWPEMGILCVGSVNPTNCPLVQSAGEKKTNIFTLNHNSSKTNSHIKTPSVHSYR